MARDKGFEQRMQGMVYACQLAQKQGIEALVKEVQKRGVTRVDLYAKQAEMDNMWGTLSDCILQNVLVTAAWVLNDKFGFGKQRLHKFMTEFTQATEDVRNLDYMGEHYVRLEDYAIELNKKYDLGLDVIKAAVETEMFDENNPKYRNTDKVTGIINALRLAGYEDAAAYLESKKGN